MLSVGAEGSGSAVEADVGEAESDGGVVSAEGGEACEFADGVEGKFVGLGVGVVEEGCGEVVGGEGVVGVIDEAFGELGESRGVEAQAGGHVVSAEGEEGVATGFEGVVEVEAVDASA